MTAIPQHMQALQRGNKIRLARAGLKRQVANGETTVVAVLQDIPEHAEKMPVYDLLTAQHRWGRSRARKLLAVAQVREGKKLGELTQRQRLVICDLLNWGVA